jgi:hypothetical protein
VNLSYAMRFAAILVATMTSCVRQSLPTISSGGARPIVVDAVAGSNCHGRMRLGSSAVCSAVVNDTEQTCFVDPGEYSARDCMEGAWPRIVTGEVLVLDSSVDRNDRDHLRTYIQASRGQPPTRVEGVSTAMSFHSSATFFVSGSDATRPRSHCWVASNAELTCRRFEVAREQVLFVVDGEPRDSRPWLDRGVYASADGTRCIYENGEEWRRGDCRNPTSPPIGRVWGNARINLYESGLLVTSMGGHVQWISFADEPARGAHFSDLVPLLGAVRVGDHLLLSTNDKSLWIEFSSLEPIP